MDILKSIELIYILIGTFFVGILIYNPFVGLLTMTLMLPLEPILTFSSGFTGIKVIGIITLTSFALHCLFGTERIRIDIYVFLPLLLFLLWAALRAQNNYVRLLTLCQVIALFVMINSMCSENERRIKFIMGAYVIGCLIATGMASINYLIDSGYTARGSLEGQNANEFALNTGIGIFLLICAGARVKGYKLFMTYGLVIPLIYGLIISASRGAVVAVLLTLLLYSALSMTRFKSFVTVALLLLLVATTVAGGLRMGLISDFSVERLESTKSYEKTTLMGRFYIWRVAHRMIADNFITGVGLGNFRSSFNKYAGKLGGGGWTPHNTYISILAETGAIGLLIILWFIFVMAFTIAKSKSENRIHSINLCVYISISAIKGTYHFSKIFWFAIAMSLLLTKPWNISENAS